MNSIHECGKEHPPEWECYKPDVPVLYRYEQRPEEDVLLLLWWERMRTLGDLETTFGEQSRSISRFLGLMGHAHDDHRGLYYRLDSAGRIGLAALVVPTMTNCAFLTFWLSPAWRMTSRGREAASATYDVILSTFPVLLGFTRQPRLLAIHARFGYRPLGMLPGVFDHHDGWILSLTRQDFDAARARGFRAKE